MHLARFPRVRLGHMNTPLELLPRLTEALDGPEIWIKRDDCTGLSTGGNKTRKLEFLMAEAISQSADIVLTQGAIQSNHARQTAAAAAKLGIKCHILLEDRTGMTDISYRENGNVLLNQLHGASMEHRVSGLDMNTEMEASASELKKNGNTVYIIPGGGSNPTGALGYANCAQEIIVQSTEMGLEIDHIIHATGSAGTQAGLIAGLKALNASIPLLGIGVRASKQKQEENVYNLACATAEKLGCAGIIERNDIVANCDYVGPGYGFPSESTLEAIDIFARLEGILLDPVYSGKGAAGLIDLIRKGEFKRGQRLVFIHTGGAIALAGYLNSFK